MSYDLGFRWGFKEGFGFGQHLHTNNTQEGYDFNDLRDQLCGWRLDKWRQNTSCGFLLTTVSTFCTPSVVGTWFTGQLIGPDPNSRWATVQKELRFDQLFTVQESIIIYWATCRACRGSNFSKGETGKVQKFWNPHKIKNKKLGISHLNETAIWVSRTFKKLKPTAQINNKKAQIQFNRYQFHCCLKSLSSFLFGFQDFQVFLLCVRLGFSDLDLLFALTSCFMFWIVNDVFVKDLGKI